MRARRCEECGLEVSENIVVGETILLPDGDLGGVLIRVFTAISKDALGQLVLGVVVGRVQVAVCNALWGRPRRVVVLSLSGRNVVT